MQRFHSLASTLRPLGLAAIALSMAASVAQASTIAVQNASFETLPAGQPLSTYMLAGVNEGSYTVLNIPGWVSSGTAGQLIIAPTNNLFSNMPSDGPTVAYSNQFEITQTLADLAIAGVTYTLTYDLGYRYDFANMGAAGLRFGDTGALHSGAVNLEKKAGQWFTFTSVYQATAADAGKAITIVLDPGGDRGQALFDNIRLSDDRILGLPSPAVEPSTWAMMVLGFGAIGAGLRRRKSRLA